MPLIPYQKGYYGIRMAGRTPFRAGWSDIILRRVPQAAVVKRPSPPWISENRTWTTHIVDGAYQLRKLCIREDNLY